MKIEIFVHSKNVWWSCQYLSFYIKFVPDCYKTQEICDKAVNRCFLPFIHIHDWYKTEEKCHSNISEDPFSIMSCPYKYKTQRMCDDVVDDCLAAWKFVSDWFVTSKMLEKFDNALHANGDILFYSYNKDFDKVTFIANQRHILDIDLDNWW